MRIFTLPALAAAAVLASACGKPASDDHAFTLYRNSVEDAQIRIHVASFDADEDATYNQENCDIAQELFQRHRGAAVKYWCEKGRYREAAAAT